MMIEELVWYSNDPIVHYRFAHELWTVGEYAKAITHFEHAIGLDPDHLDSEVFAFAAWLLATCPEMPLRNGPRAVELATIACELTDWQEGWSIGILAASYAQAGDLPKAIELQRQACELAFDIDQEMLNENLRLLEAGQPLPFDCYP